jgi:hypothetical protein
MVVRSNGTDKVLARAVIPASNDALTCGYVALPSSPASSAWAWRLRRLLPTLRRSAGRVGEPLQRRGKAKRAHAVPMQEHAAMVRYRRAQQVRVAGQS